MSTTKSIPGMTRGPDFEREATEARHVEKVQKAVKLERPTEANDPIIQAAIDAIGEVSAQLGRKVDVQYERESGLVVMTVLENDGKTVVRRIPPEDAIRMAQHAKENRAKLIDSVF